MVQNSIIYVGSRRSYQDMQVAFVAIIRPRPNLKIKHEINYGIGSLYLRGARKLKLYLVEICYNNTYNKHNGT